MATLSRATVVLVEADTAICQLLTSVLRIEGYQVLATHDGEAGLHLITATAPAVIILNLQLPTLNGEALLSAIRSNPHLQHIPVVVFSSVPGFPDGVIRQVQAAFTKPFDITRLMELITHWAPHHIGSQSPPMPPL